MKRRYRILLGTLVFAIVLVALGLFMIRFIKPQTGIGLADDLKDVDLANVIAFAQRANDAYHEEKIFRHEYGDQTDYGEFPISGLRIYINRDSKASTQWVIIRGTANLPNIRDDLEFVGREEHELGINVHAGFDSSLQECLPWVIKRLAPDKPVWVVGHSLGGAVAALLIATLDHRGFTDVSGITFGQPKFTDAHGVAKLAHLRLLRVVHEEDPVPMLPPTMIEGRVISTYAHLGPEVIVRKDGHFSFLASHDADRMNIANYWREIEDIQPIYHDMTRGYLPALELALEGARKKVGLVTTP